MRRRTEQQLIDAWNQGDDEARLELRERDTDRPLRGIFFMTKKEQDRIARAGVRTYRELIALAETGTPEDQDAFRSVIGVACIRCLDSGIAWPNGFREAPYSKRCRHGA